MKGTILAFAVLGLCGCSSAEAQRADNYMPDNPHVVLKETNLPIVFIDVDGREIQREERIIARMKIIDNGQPHTMTEEELATATSLNYADTLAHPNQHVDYTGNIALKYRGNSTFNGDKKPYSFHTLRSPIGEFEGEKQKVRLLGMNSDDDWALMAPYADRSMMRDLLAYELSRPWMEFVPQGRYCELILDGTYYGVYVLSELVSDGKNRLNLQRPGYDGNPLTGDYLMEVDRDDGQGYYTSRYNPVNDVGTRVRWITLHYKYEWPKYDELTEEQRAYISSCIDDMEDAFAADNYDDPQTGYRQYIDVRSFIDYQLATEFGHNVDGYRLSSKFYKRRDRTNSRFHMALWDMNLAYGNSENNNSWRTDGWAYKDNSLVYKQGERQMPPFWWYKLNSDPNYVFDMQIRWWEYRNANFQEERIMELIDSLATELTSHGAMERNSQAWPRWGKYIWPNKYVAPDFESEVAYLKQWLTERLAWMDEQLELQAVAIRQPRPSEQPRRIDGYYTLGGMRVKKPEKGIYVLRYNDGTSHMIHIK